MTTKNSQRATKVVDNPAPVDGSPATTTPRDAVRVKAESFLANLPDDVRGVIITERGTAILNSKTELRDSISLVEMYKHDLLSQAERMAEALAALVNRQEQTAQDA